ncbi:zinc finger and BTB domain-containing protein 11-like isoform X2 [Sitophilus oryzae]|uniref:Zinc finger and BTB domain-containing protein 11-like isoform X2 n=1 Tax=Sitophilus oryzae TaxID=7048 RepID=A0A6J2YFD9_SITOR|nr:zinc finger and BTB domain-containing protein 11-like isoform X2 [Sitophilus oryzae]
MSFNLRYILIKRCWNSEEKMAELDDQTNDQQFCLKWNNFQANITSQFEALRFSEDFTDVTIACDGQQLQAHKVVLSACSPYFKELFKANPCSHPIIFMRDVEARHIIALMEFMYVGEVNVSQTHLSTFLKTAESLKIRGLTDTSSESDVVPEENSLYLKPQTRNNGLLVNKNKPKTPQISSTSTVTSSQDVPLDDLSNILMPNSSSPAPKRHCKSETEIRVRKEESMTVNPFAIQGESRSQPELLKTGLFPKVELPEYISDDDNDASSNFYNTESNLLPGGIDILPQTASFLSKDIGAPDLSHPSLRIRRRRVSDHWSPYSLHHQGNGFLNDFDSPPRIFDRREPERRSKLVKLGEGIEIYEDQLRSIKWSDYRKLTRGLATILFSPAELATCSVTGQRWSRAGSSERPVKPALDRAKVQAIISYVADRFPMVEISRIKQVLAYKCKENSTAFKMKAVRYYGHEEQLNSFALGE